MDYIVFYCSECGAKLGVDRENAGLTAICAKCSKPIKVPSQSSKTSSNKLIERPSDESHSTSEFAEQFLPEYAGFWRRFAAAFIDATILFICSFVIIYIIGYILGVTISKASLRLNVQKIYTLGNLLGVLLYWIYYAIFESSPKQATLGKMLLQIKVTNIDGTPISFARATGRYFGKFISILTFGFGYLMAGFSKRKQALHDIISNCLVIYRDSEAFNNHDDGDIDRLPKKMSVNPSSTRNNVLLLVLGIFLHMFFAQENNILYFIYTNGIGPQMIFSYSFWRAHLGAFIYASVGIIFAMIFIFPIAYFFIQSSKKQLLKSINYAIYIGLLLRVLSYFLPEGPN